MAEQLPGNTAELLSQIEREWKSLLGVVGRISPEQMVTPDAGGWSPKDNLAHLEAWMHFLDASYLGGQSAHAALGIDAATYARLDEDGQNAVLVARNRQRTAADVLQGLRRTYAQVMETIRARPFGDLLKPLREDDPEKTPLIRLVLGNTSEHFAEHRLTIEKNS